MKFFFELGDRYAEKSDWTDFALTKFCLCAMGILIGLLIPKKHRDVAAGAAGAVFAASYVPLMIRMAGVAKEMIDEKQGAVPDEE